MTLDDERWKNIERRENDCNEYLQGSTTFLFNILQNEPFKLPASASVTENTALDSPTIYILPKQPARFYGRITELDQISKSLECHNSVTIRGMQGVGKSSIALRFAHESLSKYSVIVWMRSDQSTALDQSCQEALGRLGVIGEPEKPGIENRQRWRDYFTRTGLSAMPLGLHTN